MINVLGQVPHDEIYDLLKEADVFVTASEGEGCSISVLEGCMQVGFQLSVVECRAWRGR